MHCTEMVSPMAGRAVIAVIQFTMAQSKLPTDRQTLASISAQVINHLEDLLSPFPDPPNIVDFPRSRRSGEAALRLRLTRSQADLFTIESHLDSAIEDLECANASPSFDPSLLPGQEYKQLLNQRVVVRSAVYLLERQNAALTLDTFKQPLSREAAENEALQQSIEAICSTWNSLVPALGLERFASAGAGTLYASRQRSPHTMTDGQIPS
jgi:hypothetical protein